MRLIVPYPPGGSADILARAIGQKLAEGIGQQVIVDNRPGAGTAIGAEAAAKAPPDGYTIMLGTVSSHAINPALTPGLKYDPVKDFAPVSLVASIPFALIVHPSVPANSVRDLIALAKSKPGALNFSSAGTGTSNHLAGELFKSMTGTFMVHIPYKGSAPALNDLIAGQVQLMFDLVLTTAPHVKSGAVRALAVTGRERSAALPGVPTVAESGVPGLRSQRVVRFLRAGRHARRDRQCAECRNREGDARAGSARAAREPGRRCGHRYARPVRGVREGRTRQMDARGESVRHEGGLTRPCI